MRCPHCHQYDDEMVRRGYCRHCKEDVAAALPDDPGGRHSSGQEGFYAQRTGLPGASPVGGAAVSRRILGVGVAGIAAAALLGLALAGGVGRSAAWPWTAVCAGGVVAGVGLATVGRRPAWHR